MPDRMPLRRSANCQLDVPEANAVEGRKDIGRHALCARNVDTPGESAQLMKLSTVNEPADIDVESGFTLSCSDSDESDDSVGSERQEETLVYVRQESEGAAPSTAISDTNSESDQDSDSGESLDELKSLFTQSARICILCSYYTT